MTEAKVLVNQIVTGMGITKPQLAALLGTRKSTVDGWAGGRKMSASISTIFHAIRNRMNHCSKPYLQEMTREVMRTLEEKGPEAGVYVLLDELFGR